jgi:inner membrane protein
LPTIFTHAVAALSIGTAVLPKRTAATVWTCGIVCAVIPDADVVAFYVGIPYSGLLGHRGLTHSLLFAALLSLAVLLLLRNHCRQEPQRIALFLLIVSVSHGVLDAFTNGGLGVAFFAPFSAERFFFPLQPIEVSPIGAAFFSLRGWWVLQSELLWVWVPAAALAATALAVRARFSR